MIDARPGWKAAYSLSVAQRWGNGNLAVVHYKERLARLVRPGQRILHAGCGWDRVGVTAPYRAQCEIVGVDRDPRVAGRFHSAFYVGDLADLPFADQSFDLIVSEYVVEHLEAPGRVFREFRRVLKPEGRALLLTPNLWSYKAIGAALTPHWFHRLMGRLRYGPGREADMYPTVYRCNTTGAFRRLARQSGFRVTTQDLVTNGPTWFANWPLALPIFDSYHRVIAKWEAFRHLRCNLIVELVPDGSPPTVYRSSRSNRAIPRKTISSITASPTATTKCPNPAAYARLLAPSRASPPELRLAEAGAAVGTRLGGRIPSPSGYAA